jgi:glycosyltransferase involved in cell wall biosynthesis
LKGIVKEALYGLGLRSLLPWYSPPEAYRKRNEAIRNELEGCAAIISMSHSHAERLARLLQISLSRFEIINYATDDPGENYRPDEKRFSHPIRFGWMNRTSREWGIFFLAESWRRAALPPEKAQLWLYAIDGTERALRQDGFGRLIDCGSIVMKEERVFGRENQIFAELAGLIVASLWYENGCSPEYFARKLPLIVPDRGAHQELVQDGVSGFLYRKGDPDSLAGLLRRLVDNPALLKDVADRYGHLPEYGLDAWGRKHVQLYERILSQKGTKG